jgi:hypothetical protein
MNGELHRNLDESWHILWYCTIISLEELFGTTPNHVQLEEFKIK